MKAQEYRNEQEARVTDLAARLNDGRKRKAAAQELTEIVAQADSLGVKHPSLKSIKRAMASGSPEVVAYTIADELTTTGPRGSTATGSNLSHLLYKIHVAENPWQPGGGRKNPLSRSDFAEVKRITGNVGDGRTQSEAIEAGYMTADGKPVRSVTEPVVTEKAEVPDEVMAAVKALIAIGMTPEAAAMAVAQSQQ